MAERFKWMAWFAEEAAQESDAHAANVNNRWSRAEQDELKEYRAAQDATAYPPTEIVQREVYAWRRERGHWPDRHDFCVTIAAATEMTYAMAEMETSAAVKADLVFVYDGRLYVPEEAVKRWASHLLIREGARGFI